MRLCFIRLYVTLLRRLTPMAVGGRGPTGNYVGAYCHTNLTISKKATQKTNAIDLPLNSTADTHKKHLPTFLELPAINLDPLVHCADPLTCHGRSTRSGTSGREQNGK